MENTFIKGRLYATNDQGAIPDAMTCGCQVIALVDTQQSYIYNQRGCVVLSSLLPPPEAITDILNGNVPMGIQRYKAYLASPGREEVVVSLLAALVQKSRNFVLYAEYDPDVEFHILETIMSFFAEAFGVIIGWYKDPRRPATSIRTPEFDYRIADLLFTNGKYDPVSGIKYGLIDRRTYACMIPPDAIPSPKACQTLLSTVNYGFQTMEDCVKVCMSMLEDIRTEAKTGMRNPMGFTKADLSSAAMEEIRRRKVEAQVMNAGNVVTGN